MIRAADEIISKVKQLGRRKKWTVVVANAQDRDVLAAVGEVYDEGIARTILVGDEDRIRYLCKRIEINADKFEVIHAKDTEEAAFLAVQTVAEGKADLLMKGFMSTAMLLKTVLNKSFGLKVKNTLSHCAVLSVPTYHKLLNITDGGMVVEPSFEQKLEIIENAITVSRALGINKPKITLLAATDVINPGMPASMDGAVLSKMADRGQIKDVFIDGPLTFDQAVQRSSSEHMGIQGGVTGDTDVIVVSSIEEGNIISKSLILFAGAIFAGVIVGAKVPVSLVSRTDSSLSKKASIALGLLVADYLKREGVFHVG
ncbi:bifunctional enoyl-CoA hydratase/phosphate acetyltransferase [candidate division KSB1 bacterium]|nr:bifunctional enoyl-CoA hydratase/phosphate acetyltransferase [candidate division KSB1 bacterium]